MNRSSWNSPSSSTALVASASLFASTRSSRAFITGSSVFSLGFPGAVTIGSRRFSAYGSFVLTTSVR